MTSISWMRRAQWVAMLVLAGCGGGGGGSSPSPPTDTTPPDTIVHGAPPAYLRKNEVEFTVSSTEGGNCFQLKINSGDWLNIGPLVKVMNLFDGVNTLMIRACDSFGNFDPSPAVVTWTQDTLRPVTTLDSTPLARSVANAAIFTFASSEAGSSFQASVDGAAYAAVASPLQLAGLSEGGHAIAIRATDVAGNVEETPATFSWNVDTVLPAVNVWFPAAHSYTDAATLHVRGIAQDANGVVNLSVNGVDATTTDGYAHWVAQVPLLVGDNALVVRATDGFGNQDLFAATLQVTNRGTVAQDLGSLAFDPGSNRLLLTDTERRALIGVRVTDRHASVISDATHGAGTALQQPSGLVVDGNRALVTDSSSDRIIGIDLVNGDRTVLAPAGPADDLRVHRAIAFDPSAQRVYVGTLDQRILVIDLANPAVRSVLSGGGVGNGPPLGDVVSLTFSSANGPRLLAGFDAGHGIMDIDVASGDRSYVTYAAPLDPGNQVGSGSNLYGLGQLVVQGHRVLAADVGPNPNSGRLFAIDLGTGDRTPLTAGTTDLVLRRAGALAVDHVNGHVYIGMADRSRVVRFDLAQVKLEPFFDSNVGSGQTLASPAGLLLRSSAGTTQLFSPTLTPVATLQRTDVGSGDRTSISIYPGLGDGPAFTGPGNPVADPRPGMDGRALFLDVANDGSSLALRGIDLSNGNRTLLADAPLPGYRFLSRMAVDLEGNRTIVGLSNPAGGAGSIVAMDLTSGALTTLASLSIGNGPPIYEVGAVAPVPSTFGTTARVLVAADTSLLALNGSGDRSFISADNSVGTGPRLVWIEDMQVDFARNRALVASSIDQALQWVDLTSGARTMVSGRNPDSQAVIGAGPPILGPRPHLAMDPVTGVGYLTVMQGAILAVDLDSGDRVIVAR